MFRTIPHWHLSVSIATWCPIHQHNLQTILFRSCSSGPVSSGPILPQGSKFKVPTQEVPQLCWMLTAEWCLTQRVLTRHQWGTKLSCANKIHQTIDRLLYFRSGQASNKRQTSIVVLFNPYNQSRLVSTLSNKPQNKWNIKRDPKSIT